MPSGHDSFKLVSDFELRGDQRKAIRQLGIGLKDRSPSQVLLGVTGSGKTFTMAKVIAESDRPSLVMVHNKTLAAQLYQEFKRFFPENAVEYFVSYYDYYQPEAYIPSTNSYIEKEATINDEIDRMRLSATRSLFEPYLGSEAMSGRPRTSIHNCSHSLSFCTASKVSLPSTVSYAP